MGQIIGPFTVDDGTAEQIAEVQSVVARIPPAIAGLDRAGVHHLSFDPRREPAGSKRQPFDPYGYTPSRNFTWIDASPNPNSPSVKRAGASAVRQYTIAHEYDHGWMGRHGTPAMQAAIMAAMPATAATSWRGGHYTASSSNRPAEGAADSFAKALGLGGGVLPTFYSEARVNGPQLLAIMSGGRGTTVPDPKPRKARTMDHVVTGEGAHLRNNPDLAASVVVTLPSGSQIATGLTRSGSDAEVNGQHSNQWLEVLAVAGSPCQPPLWVSELVIRPLESSPTTSRPTSRGRRTTSKSRRTGSGAAAARRATTS